MSPRTCNRADRAVHRIEESNDDTTKRSRRSYGAGNETLYEQLESNDFREVEDGMKAIRERMDRMDGRLREAREERRGIAAVVEDVRRTVAVLADRSPRREDVASPDPPAGEDPASMGA